MCMDIFTDKGTDMFIHMQGFEADRFLPLGTDGLAWTSAIDFPVDLCIGMCVDMRVDM